MITKGKIEKAVILLENQLDALLKIGDSFRVDIPALFDRKLDLWYDRTLKIITTYLTEKKADKFILQYKAATWQDRNNPKQAAMERLHMLITCVKNLIIELEAEFHKQEKSSVKIDTAHDAEGKSKRILCLDCEQNFVDTLAKEGHRVADESWGYKTGQRMINTPPNEADAIIFNLENKVPACYDRTKWGPGQNSNYSCTIEKKITDTIFKNGTEIIPQYQLITENQMATNKSKFSSDDIIEAIEIGGIPLFIFLNETYLKHYYPQPTFFDIRVDFGRTEATKLILEDKLTKKFPALFNKVYPLKLPLKFNIELRVKYYKYFPVIYNNVGKIFSMLFIQKEGLIWMLPEFVRNDTAAIYLLQNLDLIKLFAKEIREEQNRVAKGVKASAGDLHRTPLPTQPETKDISQLPRLTRYEYDIAVSFAGENRDIVESYCDILKANKLKVFYDKYEKMELWGQDLYERLDEVYRKQALYCVMFISEYYAKKLWTNHERQSAQARAFLENREYILPVKIDDTEIPGVLPTVGYQSLNDVTIEELAEMTIQKVNILKKTVG